MGIDDDMDEFFEKKRREGAGPISRKVHRREERCTTHHHACECREAKVGRLVESMRLLADLDLWQRECVSHGYMAVSRMVMEAMGAMKEWEGEYEG
jgi:hypothetical protein